MSFAVEIKQLTKVFRSSFRAKKLVAVNDLDIEMQEGEVYGLLGPNGSGKSTTMKILLGILRPTTGYCRVFGLASSSAQSRAQVGYVPENPYFYKHLDAQETLRFYGELSGMSDRVELDKRIDELLALVKMEDARHRRVGGYSKGMLQRIGLAAALVHRPRILLLDEPTAGVDPSGSRMIRDLIMDLKEQGITILLSSHLLEQVQEVCDRVGILSQGKMVREGKIDELLSIETQRQLVLENVSEEDFQQLQDLARSKQAQVVYSGRPKTTLEKLFIEETGDESLHCNKEVVAANDLAD